MKNDAQYINMNIKTLIITRLNHIIQYMSSNISLRKHTITDYTL